MTPNTSKKPSATSGSPPDERPVIFLDRAIEGRMLVEALTAAGANLQLHSRNFAPDSADVEWLPIVGERGWFVLTRDTRIQHNPLEAQALQQANVGAFIFVPRNLTGAEMAEILVQALPNIEKAARETERPFILKVYRDGALKKFEIKRPPHR